MKTVKLGEIAELTVGFVGSMTEQYVDEGVPFLRSLNIKPFEINNDDIRYITEEFNKKIKKSMLHSGDVVIIRTGVPGTCCVVPEEYDGCNCSDVVIVRPNKELVDPLYLAGFVNFWGQKQISNNKVGAIQQHFNVRIAEEMLIMLPNLDKQRKIGKILGNLNGKINANKAINDNLHQQLSQLYNYWFEQKHDWQNKHSGKIMDLCRINSGYSFKSEMYSTNGIYRLITIKNVQDSGLNLDVDNYINKMPIDLPSYCLLKRGDILMSLTGNVGRVAVNYGDYCLLNQRVACITPINNDIAPFIYCLFKSDRMRTTMESIATGTSQKNLSPVDTENLKVEYDLDIINKFSIIARPYYEQIIANYMENRKLSSFRDWLLPMLMNGQATIID